MCVNTESGLLSTRALLLDLTCGVSAALTGFLFLGLGLPLVRASSSKLAVEWICREAQVGEGKVDVLRDINVMKTLHGAAEHY